MPTPPGSPSSETWMRRPGTLRYCRYCPLLSGISYRLSDQTSQEVWPWNVRFAEEADEPGYAARGPGELPVGVERLPGERPMEGGISAETSRDVSAETRGVGNPAHPGTSAPSLVALMRMTREEWDALSRGSAIRRAGYTGFKRNVAVAMGNWLASVEEPPAEAVAALREALEDESELVREHAAWGLRRARAD